jgi:phosphatidylglycerol lysyltransferase
VVPAVVEAEDRARALAILRGHAWTTVSFQVLEPGFRYWFDGDDAFVAYVDTGSAWVAGGGPIAPTPRLADVAARFAGAARAAGRRACFFGCEERFVAATALPALQIGEQPVWAPAAWDGLVAATRSLRYQLRRARARGVTVRVVGPDELADRDGPLARAIAALGAHWLETRRMAPMGFLVQLEPLNFVEERVVAIAERAGAVVGYLSAVPVYGRRRLFVEDVVRARGAPNGTAELLIDAAMRAAVARGDTAVTLGIAPLAGEVAPLLKVAGRLSAPLYDFRGLHAFKAKLRPERWEPVYLCAPASRWRALRDALTAFARGSLVRFGLATLRRRPALAALAMAGVALAIAAVVLAIHALA